jgi:prepilin signal peptidase PulO-like enzyme (type II secretory pathway)
MILFFIFLLGVIVGSFLNVVGLRWNSGIDLGGRSFCPTCRKKLSWWELFPVISFFFLKGRCKGCKSLISWQYPLVELWTGLLFVTTYIVISPQSFFTLAAWLVTLLIFCIYVVITIYDLRHKIIPDPLVYISIALGIILQLLNLNISLMDWLAGPILFTFFGLIWLLSRGRAMGFGDAKLGLSVGLLLGLAQGISAIILAFWIGTVITLLYMALSRLDLPLWRGGKRLTMKSEVPFAPFIILGAWISFIFQFDLFHVLSFF